MEVAANPDVSWLPYVGTVIGTIIALYVAYRAEHNSRVAKNQSATAEIIAKADKARIDYIDILEERLNYCTIQAADSSDRIKKLEASESICQQERVLLLAENSDLRRRIERLERLEKNIT